MTWKVITKLKSDAYLCLLFVPKLCPGVSTSGGEGNEQRANRIFAELDINGDGEVTKEEFVRGCMQDKDLIRMLSSGGVDQDEELCE